MLANLTGVIMPGIGDTMPKKHKRLSYEDALVRDLEIVRLKLTGMTSTAIARKFRLTGGRVTQILHSVAGRLAPRTFKGY